MHIEFIEKVSGLMVTAFGLVAALAWNDAIKAMFAPGGIFEKTAAYGVWAYALFVTLIAVVITIHLSKLEAKAKDLKAKKDYTESNIRAAKEGYILTCEACEKDQYFTGSGICSKKVLTYNKQAGCYVSCEDCKYNEPCEHMKEN